MDKLNAMRVFICVTETGSFSKAADVLNTTPSYVSKQVSALEKSLGARLMQRTTRVLSLTEVGKSYLGHCRTIMDQISVAESEVAELLGSPSGRLRVSMSNVLGDRPTAVMCAEFLKRYPDIELDLQIEDRFVDLIEEGFDLCVRASDRFPDSSLIYKRVGDLRVQLMASPDYLAQYGHPQTASDLSKHVLISHRYSGSNTFAFEKDGDIEHVTFAKQVRVNGTAFVRHIVEQGVGIGFLPTYCRSAVEGGTNREDSQSQVLVPLLQDYTDGSITISLVYPDRTYTPLKVQKFNAFFEEWFKSYTVEG
ncbi:LysR family transcriptional regulator [Vibrio mexicanus]|uniref:LysR family transcriptional regulator n=1 Tax=Vibrio mexicanus TaxID=1004326 RepID=UPI0009499E42|nr:LysR family transcriptional regulator [Vibrio mexicanus]